MHSTTDTQKQNEAALLERIAYIFCQHVNPDYCPVSVEYNQDLVSTYTLFDVMYNGERVAYYRMYTNYWKDVLQGNKQPKISSQLFSIIKK